MLSTKSIKFFVAIKTAPWIVVFILAAGLVIFFIEKSIFNEQLNRLHEGSISRFVENRERVIDGFLGQVNAIATNDLVVNGLIDDVKDSSNYLGALVNSYSLAGTEINSVKVVDYNGSIIVSNGIEISGLPVESFSIFNEVINNVVSHYEYTSNSVVFVSPIWLAESAEGAVVVELPYRDLNEVLKINALGGEIVNVNGDNEILFSSNHYLSEKFLLQFKNIQGNLFSNIEEYDNWYVDSVSLEDGSFVYSFVNKNFIDDNLYLFYLLGIISLVIACVGSLIGVILSSSIISKTLNDLLWVLKNGKENEVKLDEYIANDEDPEELVKVYQNFNVLLSDLTRSETFGNDIQNIINSLSECLVVFDMDGVVSLSNKSFKNFSDSILSDGDDFEKIIPETLRCKALSAEASMKDFEFIYKVLSSVGSNLNKKEEERAIRWSRSLYLNPREGVGGLTFIGVDVTEQKAIEKDIKEKNKAIQDLSRRFNLALEASFIGVWDFNVDDGTLIWDKRMHEIYKIRPEEFSGSVNDWIACVHPEDFEKTHDLLQESLTSEVDFFADFRIIWPNSEVRWISANARVMNEEGSLRLVGANVDVTETKRLNKDLEAAVNKAEDLVQIKSDFLASMSHEIRTPMNGVLGMLNLLKRTPLTVQQSRYTELAHSSADSLLALINDILDFSKVDAGKLELEFIDFNLPNILGEIAESMAQRAQDKGLEIVLDIANINIDIVNGDPSRLRQIFTNLIGNAIKFTDKGEILIAASIVLDQNGGLLFKASIKDTGIGIPEEKIDSLFDSFSQVDASTTRRYGGTGLGLAIVKQLCQLMDGNVNISSELNHGSEFNFTIALRNAQQTPADDSSLFHLAPIDLEGKPIMVIDDNFINANVLQKQLIKWGAKVSAFYSIDDSLTYLTQANLPSFIFIDANMTVMDGLAFTQHLRKESRFDNVNIVLMTDIASTIYAEDIENIGLVTSFPKPIIRNDLLTALFPTAVKIDTIKPASTINEELQQPMDNMILSSKNIFDTRILLVEDNVINQEVALGILSSLELTADIAANGLAAINILNEKKYDLILMDCQMPEMDGYAATRAIRSGKTLQPNVPIIAMTANAMKGDKEKCLTAGMDDYLSKPIDPQKLIEKIDEWSTSLANEDSEKEINTMVSITDHHENAIIWDRDDFMNRIMNNETLAHKLVDLFKVDAPKTLHELGVAVGSNKAGQAGLLAHKLKGTVSNLGGIELAGLAHEIEQAGREEDINSIKKLWPMVQPKYDQLLVQIERGL